MSSSEPQETVAAVPAPAAEVEVPAATEPEAPIATQVIAADENVRGSPLSLLCLRLKRFELTVPQFDDNDSAVGEVFIYSDPFSGGCADASWGNRTRCLPLHRSHPPYSSSEWRMGGLIMLTEIGVCSVPNFGPPNFCDLPWEDSLLTFDRQRILCQTMRCVCCNFLKSV